MTNPDARSEIPLISRALVTAVCVASLVILQLALAWSLLPTDLSHPLVQDDYALHLASAEAARETWQTSGRLWGWDPGTMAGYPAGTWDALSNHAGIVAVAWMGFLPAAEAFAWVLIALSVLPVLAGWATAAALGWSGWWRAATAGVFVLLYWSMTSEPGAFLSYGMYGFAGVLCLVPLVLAFAGRAVEGRRSALPLLAVTLVSALASLLHPFFVALAGASLGLSWLGGAHRRRVARWVGLLACTVVGGVLSLLPWADGLFRTRGALAPAAPFFQDTTGDLGEWLRSPEVLLWLLGSVGIWIGWRHRGTRPVATLFGSTATVLLVLGGFGAWIPGAELLEPGRFLGGLSFLLAVPALYVVRRSVMLGSPLERVVPVVVLVASLLPGALAALGAATGSERLLAWTGEPSGDGRLPPDLVELVDALPGLVSPEARLMAEDSDHDVEGHKWGDTHLLALLPRMIDREVIGGPMEESRLAHHFVDFNRGRFLGNPLAGYDDEELIERLAFLNVGTIVAWSEDAVGDLETRPFLTEEATFGRYRVFGVQRLPAWFPGALAASVRASVDRIEVFGAPEGPIVLPYHWDAAWTSEPDLALRRADRFGDPIGFVEVENGATRNFVLRYEP